MLAGIALILGLAGNPLAPSLAVDLDGDGSEETATAAAARGAVRLEIRDAAGKKLAEAKAPAPAADVVHVALAAGSLGSAGSLLEVSASSDASECVSIWRYKDRAVARMPLRSADGKDLPDCARLGEWTYGWDRRAEGQPAVFVREQSVQVATGALRVREAFVFAGFSLDQDARRSSWDVNGVPIPQWYDATLYTRSALETLYGRFDLAKMRSEPVLSIATDRKRGVFALRFSGPKGEVTAPVDSYAARSGVATLGARLGDRTANVSVRLVGDGVPFEVVVGGLGAPLDQEYAPAGARHSGSVKVYPDAPDELASEYLAGLWGDPHGAQQTIAIDGAPPYRVRMGAAVYAVDMARAKPPVDLVLLPTEASGGTWGIVLKGPNAFERIPFACGADAAAGCRAEGPGEILRRLGARVNAR